MRCVSLGEQFVMGESIGAALERSRRDPAYLYSFDMLGEAAMTEADAARYFEAYSNAIETVGHEFETAGSPDRGAEHLDQALGALPAL